LDLEQPQQSLEPVKNKGGRPRGSGKANLFRDFATAEAIPRLFDFALGKGHGYKIHGQKIIEVGPSAALQLEAIKLVLAYGLGRPVIPFVMDDRSRDPEGSKRRAEEVLKMMQELENDANNGTETGASGSGVGDRPASVQTAA
jgi:hypothetical protein